MMERERRRGPADGALDDQEVAYLRLLQTLSEAAEHGADSTGVVRRIATWIESSRVLEIIAEQPAWLEHWGIKEALVQNPSTPELLRGSLERQVAVIELLRELDGGGFSEAEREEILGDARALIGALPLKDRKAVQKQAYELSRSRAEPGGAAPGDTDVVVIQVPVGVEEPALEETVLPYPEPIYEELSTEELGALFPEQTPVARQAPGSADKLEEAEAEAEADAEKQAKEEASPRPSWQADEARAAVSEDAAELSHLAHSANEAVQLALVANPRLPETAAVHLTRRAGYRVAEAVFRNRSLFNRPRVRSALLECPNAPVEAQLQAVNHLSEFTVLVRLLGSPRVRHLEVKSKARSRLRSMFKALSQGEKVAAIRRSGRGILRHLWSDFFRDETLVLRCLREKQLNEGMVLEIARSRIAPRRALEVIGGNPAWTAQYPVLHALVANPKTPRQLVARLMPKLKPADRKALQRNPAGAAAVRYRA